MFGAILGDMIGAPYEFDRGDKTKDFPMFTDDSQYTDDTVMTIAVAEALMDTMGKDEDAIKAALVSSMQRWGKQYPNAGYGGMFYRWLRTANPKPYGSFGKTSGARRIDISGKIDLALRYPDGTWRIVDYKTDRMLPCDRGDAQAFRRRLDQEYGNQLSTYQAVLEYLTGEKVIEAKLLAI